MTRWPPVPSPPTLLQTDIHHLYIYTIHPYMYTCMCMYLYYTSLSGHRGWDHSLSPTTLPDSILVPQKTEIVAHEDFRSIYPILGSTCLFSETVNGAGSPSVNPSAPHTPQCLQLLVWEPTNRHLPQAEPGSPIRKQPQHQNQPPTDPQQRPFPSSLPKAPFWDSQHHQKVE